MKPLAREGAARILELPRAYSWFADLIGGDAREAYTRDYVKPAAGQRILDIGCGSGDIVSELPAGVEYVGFDSNPKYIDAARARFGERATFRCETISSAVASRYSRFDIAMANGVLHHLDDAQTLELLQLAHAALSPGGRLITLDGCYVRSQSQVQRLLLWLDRGKYVRTVDGYIALAQRVFRSVVPHVRRDLLRISYTHLILECRP
jgi:SAM-dependent methyltransferase